MEIWHAWIEHAILHRKSFMDSNITSNCQWIEITFSKIRVILHRIYVNWTTKNFHRFVNLAGYYSRWNAALSRSHPSLWLFIRQMKDNQELDSIRIRSVERGQLQLRQRKKWRSLEMRIRQLRLDYHNGDRNVDQYWSAVRHCVKNYR